MSTVAHSRLVTSCLPSATAQAVSPATLPAHAFTYIFRGGAVLTAALSNYALECSSFVAPWLPWMVLMPLSAVVLAIRGRRLPMGTTAADRTMRLLQKSFVLTIIAAMLAASFVGWATVHPLLLLVYGLSTVMAGRVLNFQPLVVGGVAGGMLGLVALAVPADVQLLLIAVAMLVSYLVPGFMLRAQGRLAA